MINDLKTRYESVIEFILSDLPQVNWNSSKEIVKYLNETLDIDVKDAKIKTVAGLLQCYDENSYEFNVISGLTYYLKLKYTLKNYIGCILRHETNGIVALRLEDGEWKMPNKQPLPIAPEINECIIARYS